MKPPAIDLLKATLTVRSLGGESVTPKRNEHLIIVLEEIKLDAPKNASGVSLKTAYKTN
jgi:hypothetical protein